MVSALLERHIENETAPGSCASGRKKGDRAGNQVSFNYKMLSTKCYTFKYVAYSSRVCSPGVLTVGKVDRAWWQGRERPTHHQRRQPYVKCLRWTHQTSALQVGWLREENTPSRSPLPAASAPKKPLHGTLCEGKRPGFWRSHNHNYIKTYYAYLNVSVLLTPSTVLSRPPLYRPARCKFALVENVPKASLVMWWGVLLILE